MDILGRFNKHLEDAMAGKKPEPAPQKSESDGDLEAHKQHIGVILNKTLDVLKSKNETKILNTVILVLNKYFEFDGNNKLFISFANASNALVSFIATPDEFEICLEYFFDTTKVFIKEVPTEERKNVLTLYLTFLSSSIFYIAHQTGDADSFMSSVGKELYEKITASINHIFGTT